MTDQTYRLDDYKITVDLWRQYVNTRFNLLRLVPLATGVGVAVVGDGEPSKTSALVALGALSSLFGILMYDLRNSVLHDATIHRAKALEKLLELDRVSGVPEAVQHGGPFTDRPGRGVRLLGVLGWHDRALNIVYSSSAAAWTAILVKSVLSEWNGAAESGDQWIVAAIAGLLGFVVWFSAIARWERDAGVDRRRMEISDWPTPIGGHDATGHDDEEPGTRQPQ